MSQGSISSRIESQASHDVLTLAASTAGWHGIDCAHRSQAADTEEPGGAAAQAWDAVAQQGFAFADLIGVLCTEKRSRAMDGSSR
jgi:hypothetical protein